MSAKQLVLLFAILIVSKPVLTVGQVIYSVPQQVEIADTILFNTIKKYQNSVGQKEVMVVSLERRQDTIKYYITAIMSMYRLSKNIPVVYTKLADRYILLYSGIEHSVKVGDKGQKQFLSLFRGILKYDLLADGITRDPMSVANYDPIQVTLITKAGKIVYEDFRKGFGPAGIPFLDRNE